VKGSNKRLLTNFRDSCFIREHPKYNRFVTYMIMKTLFI